MQGLIFTMVIRLREPMGFLKAIVSLESTQFDQSISLNTICKVFVGLKPWPEYLGS